MTPLSLTASLGDAANTAINMVLLSGAKSHGQSRPTGEVGFVAAVVLGAVPAIADAWRPLLKPHGLSVSLTGVFCHQTPQVSFVDSAGKSRRCELADLLVVVDDLTSGEQGRRWAVLVQAKIAARFGGITLRAPGDLVQLDLLSNWPRFNLPAGFAPGERDFRTCGHRGAALDCGTYGLIDSQAPAWRQQPPAKVMPAGGDELGTFLAHMLEDGQIGYGREATGLDDDWSKTVEELTQTTAALAFTHAAGLTGRYPRGNTGVAFCIAGDGLGDAKGSWGRRAPPSGDRPEPDDDRPGQGISTLRIAVHQSEADGER